jgi:hypothetical protein
VDLVLHGPPQTTRVHGGHEVEGPGLGVGQEVDPAIAPVERVGGGVGVLVDPRDGQLSAVGGVDPDAGVPGQVDDLLQGGDLVEAVEGGVVRSQGGQALAGTQGLELREREVLGEPARDLDAIDGLGGPAVGELRSRATSVVPEISFS